MEAAKRDAVQTWQVLGDMETVAEWVTAQYLAEGRTELPVWSSLIQSEEAVPRYPQVPSEEDVREAFAAEEAFTTFMAGEDYSYGLADVPDQEYERRCGAVETGLRALVESGKVRPGTLVRLETVPMLFLQEAPLVEGAWLDRHVVELAEWGALVKRKGFTPREDDDHLLAMPVFTKPASKGAIPAGRVEVEALQLKARDSLGRFQGRTRELEGRLYLHFEDYAHWRGRYLTGDLAKLVEPGFTMASWHAWVREQGGPLAKVAGVTVEEIGCWADGQSYQVCADAAGKQEQRRLLFERLRARTVHDPEKGALWARTSAFDRQSFAEELDAWKGADEEALAEMAALRLAFASISRRYFDGRDALFPANAEAVRVIADGLVELAGIYNRWPGEDRERYYRGPSSEPERSGTHLIDTSSLDERARGGAASLVSYLVDMGKAEAMEMMGDRREAVAIARRHLDSNS